MPGPPGVTATDAVTVGRDWGVLEGTGVVVRDVFLVGTLVAECFEVEVTRVVALCPGFSAVTVASLRILFILSVIYSDGLASNR
jgi:hypothetical protein